MASTWVKPRVTRSGLRFVVGYRLGGRGAREFHAAIFTSRAKAERLRIRIREAIAAGTIVAAPVRPVRQADELVYFARLGDLIKIGISLDPVRRARDLNAELLHVELGGRDRERELHHAFAHLRQSGEWFRDDARIRRYLDRTPGSVNPEAVEATGAAEPS